MKKIYTAIFTLAATACAMPLSAQQLDNADFEGNWNEYTPWTSNNNTKTKGTAPESWKVSHVIGVGGTGATQVGEQTTGYNSSKAVKLYNEPNPFKSSQIVPGYLTLGTPWATSKGGIIVNPSNKDGGTFGGIDFGFRPDAISFQYQRTHGSANTTEKASVVAYSWCGSTQQADVPGNNVLSGSPATVTMTDRDRNILGMATVEGGDVTKSSDFALVSKINYDINGDHASWTNLVIPFEYLSTKAPQKFNIAFCAGDYFSTSPGKANTLIIDDVKLIYYSRLASLKINGADVDGFSSDTYNYSVDMEMPAESAFAFTTMGTSGSGKATLALDQDNATATVTVTNTNAGGTDIDGNTSHTYTLQFKKAAVKPDPTPAGETVKYPGSLTITLGEAVIDSKATIEITPMSDGSYRIILPDFSLDMGDGPISLGDIVVNGAARTETNGTYLYSGKVDRMQLAGDITANVDLEGTENQGKLNMNIHVNWIDPDSGDVIAPIEVVFKSDENETYPGNKYDGTLVINIYEAELTDKASVYIAPDGNGTCTFLLPNFSLDMGEGPMPLGDIKVENVSMTTTGTTTAYAGTVDHMQLAHGFITANVNLSGTEEAGKLRMLINVDWIDPDTDEIMAPIEVTFNGTLDYSAIGGIEIDNSNAPVEYYNIQGMRVNADNLTPGIYIRRQGTDVSKIFVK